MKVIFCLAISSTMAASAIAVEIKNVQRESEGVVVRLTFQSETTLATPNPIHVEVTNKSHISSIISADWIFPDCSGVLKKADTDVPVIPTGLGAACFGGGFKSHYADSILAPGQSKKYTIDLSKCFDLTDGRYTLAFDCKVFESSHGRRGRVLRMHFDEVGFVVHPK